MSFLGGAKDGKHYWLTPSDLMKKLNDEFNFDFDACPYPKPDDFDGLECEWGNSTYVNAPFGVIPNPKGGRALGFTAWVRKAIIEHMKGKTVVMVFPLHGWLHLLVNSGVEFRSLGNVKWCATEDGKPQKRSSHKVMAFILKGRK